MKTLITGVFLSWGSIAVGAEIQLYIEPLSNGATTNINTILDNCDFFGIYNIYDDENN